MPAATAPPRYAPSLEETKDPEQLHRIIQRLVEQDYDLLTRVNARSPGQPANPTMPGAPPPAPPPPPAPDLSNRIFSLETIVAALLAGGAQSTLPSQRAAVPVVDALPPTATAADGDLVYLGGSLYRFNATTNGWETPEATTDTPQTIGPAAAKTFSDLTTFLNGIVLNGANGATFTFGWSTELVTLSLVSPTTDTAATLLPGNCILLAVPCFVTVAITGAGVTAIEAGDATTPGLTRFFSNLGLTAGNGHVGMDQWKGGAATDAAGPLLYAPSKVRLTALGGTPTAGQVRVTVLYARATPPTS